MLLWKINKPIFIVVLSETSGQVYKTLSGITASKNCFWVQNWLNLWSYHGPWAAVCWCHYIKTTKDQIQRITCFAALPRTPLIVLCYGFLHIPMDSTNVMWQFLLYEIVNGSHREISYLSRSNWKKHSSHLLHREKKWLSFKSEINQN